MAKDMLRTEWEITQIYERNIQIVYRICFTYLKNDADTEDAVQNTFIKLMNYAGEFQSVEHERAWLIVAAKNVCKDFLKHWWRKREDIEEFTNTLFQPESQGIGRNEVLESVLKLPEKYRIIVYLYYYEGYKTVELAKMFHKPHSTIRNQLSKARTILEKELGGDIYG